MLIHSYFTDGFFDWAVFYLQTLRHYNDLLYPVVFNTVGLTEAQITTLQTTYPNITVLNEPLDMARYARRSGVKIATLNHYKEQMEGVYPGIHVDEVNKVWKLMVAGEDRIKALRNIMHQHHLSEFYILHTDIDVYIRGALSPLLQFMKEYDAGVKLRPKMNPVKARITIDVMMYRICPSVFAFMDEWVRQIEKVPPLHRPRGYGQTSCWYAYRKYKRALKWAKLPLTYGLPERTKGKDIIWCGNLHKVSKGECLVRFKGDFERRKEAEL